MAILSAILLTSENKKIYIENQRQKRKRAKRRTYIAKGGVSIGAEELSLAQNIQTRHKDVSTSFHYLSPNFYYFSITYYRLSGNIDLVAIEQ